MQLCFFNEATVPRYETISGLSSQCDVFCMHMYSSADLTRRTPPPPFIDIANTKRHSDTTLSGSAHTGD